MAIILCGCARHKRGFKAIFVGGKLDGTDKSEPPTPSLRDKLRGVLERPEPVRCAGLDIAAIRCAWCGEGTYLCSCGMIACRGAKDGQVYACMCGARGTLVPLPDGAVVRGGGLVDKVLAAPTRLLIGRS
jgi:hypothetical protein